MVEKDVAELCSQVSDELSLDDDDRRRLWQAVSAEVVRGGDTVDAASVREIARGVIHSRRTNDPPARLDFSSEEAEKLLTTQWRDVPRIVAWSLSVYQPTEEELDTVESRLKELLFANDFAVVRTFRRDSSFPTFLRTIIQRLFHDVQVQRSGKWHYSSAAERIGTVAKRLERLVYRDGCEPSEAISILAAENPATSARELEAIFLQLPRRLPRPSTIELAAVTTEIGGEIGDAISFSGERMQLSATAANVVRRFLAELDDADRLMLQLIFEEELQMSKIALMLDKPLKPLYRRRDALFAELRRRLAAAGIGRDEARELYEVIRSQSIFTFGKKR